MQHQKSSLRSTMTTTDSIVLRHKPRPFLALLSLFVLVTCSAGFFARAADEPKPAAAATNAMAMATNAVAATNAPQTADSVAYPPGANAGNEQDLQWPIPGKTLENMGM